MFSNCGDKDAIIENNQIAKNYAMQMQRIISTKEVDDMNFEEEEEEGEGGEQK